MDMLTDFYFLIHQWAMSHVPWMDIEPAKYSAVYFDEDSRVSSTVHCVHRIKLFTFNNPHSAVCGPTLHCMSSEFRCLHYYNKVQWLWFTLFTKRVVVNYSPGSFGPKIHWVFTVLVLDQWMHVPVVRYHFRCSLLHRNQSRCLQIYCPCFLIHHHQR